MKDNIRKIDFKIAAFFALSFYALVIVLHVLIISGFIPYTWINGGRSESFEAQLPVSVISIVITLFAAVFTFVVSRNNDHITKKPVNYVFWFLFALWTFGFFQQLFGTPFERYVLPLLLLVGVVSNLRLALEKR